MEKQHSQIHDKANLDVRRSKKELEAAGEKLAGHNESLIARLKARLGQKDSQGKELQNVFDRATVDFESSVKREEELKRVKGLELFQYVDSKGLMLDSIRGAYYLESGKEVKVRLDVILEDNRINGIRFFMNDVEISREYATIVYDDLICPLRHRNEHEGIKKIEAPAGQSAEEYFHIISAPKSQFGIR